MPPAVRPARLEDAASIGRVHVETWQACYRGQMPDEFLDALTPSHRAEQWRRRLSADPVDGAVFVAEAEDGIIGFASCAAARGEHIIEGAGELQALYVGLAAWDTGAGRGLLEVVEQQLRGDGFATAMLWVLTANDRARRFYEIAGWRFDGTEQMYEPDGHQIPEVRYVRDLTAG